MTPVFCCGFECGVSTTAPVAHFNVNATASFNTNTSFVRSGARSMRSNPTAQSTGSFSNNILTGNVHVGRFYIYFSSLPTGDTNLLTVISGGSVVGVVFKSSDNSVYAGQTGFSFGSTGIPVTTGGWYRVDYKINISTNPWTVDVMVDSVSCGQYTVALAGSSVTNIHIGNNVVSTHDLYVDDFILSNTVADYPIGAGYVNHFVPTSDGTHNVAGAADFRKTLTGVDITNATTDAYTLVDNIPLDSGAAASVGTFVNMVAPPNATDYVEVKFGPAPGISVPTTAPRAVEVIAAIAQAGTGNGNMEIRMNDNATLNTMYTATTVAGVTTYAYKRTHYATAIAGGGAWVIGGGGDGDFTDLRVRYGSPAAVDANPDQYFSSTMIEAEFAEVAVIPNKIIQVKQAINRSNSF